MMNLYNNQDVKPVLPSLNYTQPKQTIPLPVPIPHGSHNGNNSNSGSYETNLPPLQFYSNSRDSQSSSDHEGVNSHSILEGPLSHQHANYPYGINGYQQQPYLPGSTPHLVPGSSSPPSFSGFKASGPYHRPPNQQQFYPQQQAAPHGQIQSYNQTPIQNPVSTSVSVSPRFSTTSPSNSGYHRQSHSLKGEVLSYSNTNIRSQSDPNLNPNANPSPNINPNVHINPSYHQGYDPQIPALSTSHSNDKLSIDYSSIINYTISPSLKRKRRQNSSHSGIISHSSTGPEPLHSSGDDYPQESKRSDDDSIPKLPCKVCGKVFGKPYNLKSHMKSHSNEKPFECKVCGKHFARSHDKKRHELLHKGEKNFKCEGFLNDGKTKWGCGKRFARSDALSRHFRTETGWLCIRPLMDEAKHMESNDLINHLVNR